MKIISPFKDYYDYIPKSYGEDEKVIYNRHLIDNTKPKLFFNKTRPYYAPVEIGDAIIDKISYATLYSHLNGYGSLNQFSTTAFFKTLVICGKTYLMTHENRVYTPSEEELLFCNTHYRRYKTYVKNVNPAIVELSKLIKAPVFIIERKIHQNRFKPAILIENQVPRLKDTSVPSFYPSEQLYQDLMYFICNVLNDSPDMSPSTDMTDKEKIVSHGLDLKQSFRHRNVTNK